MSIAALITFVNLRRVSVGNKSKGIAGGRKTNFRKILKFVIFYGLSIYVCIYFFHERTQSH